MKTKLVKVVIAAVVVVMTIESSRSSLAATETTGLATNGVAASAEEGKIRALEVAMMNAGQEKGADEYMAFYADNAVELPDGAPALVGKETIRKTMEFLNDKNNRLMWTAQRVDVSASGDLAYTYGVYEFHSKDKEGRPTVENGKYTTIWKKQSDGQWKVVLDMGNVSGKM
ncbi:MAG TPA: DUF4440 domain-containing protein [Candidatus Acidoferrum sp.]